jgi:myo-inositol-1(or 4)-monophosphatase
MKDLADFACTLADAAAEVILPHFRSQLAIDNKAGPAAYFDPVTVADRDAESAMRALIEHHYPTHGILGEEHGTKTGTSDHLWVLDPIDGTRGFMTGLPTWGTLIGLQQGDTPVVGVMNQPFVGERFIGSPDGAELHSRDSVTRLATRRCARLEDAVLASTSPEMFQPDELARFENIRRRVRLTRFGGDCYGFALLAAGFIDLVIEAGLKPYDIVALMPIIERAGGVVTTWEGGPAHKGGCIVAAGDRALHEAVLKLLCK